MIFLFFLFSDPATTEIYTLSLHDALPILRRGHLHLHDHGHKYLRLHGQRRDQDLRPEIDRSEEHTSELQSRPHLVCRLLLEKKKKTPKSPPTSLAHQYPRQRFCEVAAEKK